MSAVSDSNLNSNSNSTSYSELAPRLVDSQQWTELPVDFLNKVRDVFSHQFEFESLKGSFFVSGRIFPKELLVRIGYLENGRLRQINFEASLDLKTDAPGQVLSKTEFESNSEDEFDVDLDSEDCEETDLDFVKASESATVSENDSSTMDQLYVCIDALGSLMEEYFQLEEGEDIDVPINWRGYEIEGQMIYLRHSTINTQLEAEADRILGLSEKQLFHETAASEDALKLAEIDSELALEVQKAIRKGLYNPVSQD